MLIEVLFDSLPSGGTTSRLVIAFSEGTAKEMVGHPPPGNGHDGGLQLLTKTGHRKVGSGWVLLRLHRPSLPMLDLRLNNVEQTEGKTREVAGVMYLSKL